MITVKKNGKTQLLHGGVQVTAFVANGWEVVGGEDTLPTDPPADVPDATEGETDQMSALKAEADALELKYRPNIGAEKLRERIAEEKATRIAAEQNQ